MSKITGRSWKTTILGALGGLTGASAMGWTTPDGKINWMSVAIAILATAFGRASKDHNVTGDGK